MQFVISRDPVPQAAFTRRLLPENLGSRHTVFADSS